MIIAYILVILCSALSGWLVKLYLDAQPEEQKITWTEYIFGLVIIALFTPLVMYGMRNYFIQQKTTFNEWWNGWEVSATRQTITCERDGPCQHTYSCDPYIVWVEDCDTDEDGNESCTTTPETRYHDCPYVTEEWSFYIETTLGRFTVAENRFPNSPDQHIWRSDNQIPADVLSSAGQGIPAFWQEVKDRVASGKPGPVTKRMQYTNYILASEHTILKQYAKDIDALKSAGLLPNLSVSTLPIPDCQESYLANKVYFVGLSPQNQQEWFDSIGRLNAEFGKELQGDVHLVIANSKAIENIDRYFFALKAYWQNPEAFGKNMLSKNAVLILVTIDGDKVNQVRAATGMPVGNEAMVTALRSRLVGSSFDPKVIIGTVTTRSHGTGVIESVLWGLDDESTRFQRVCMDCVEEGGVGFSYLKKEIALDNGDIAIIAIIAFVASMLVWVAFAFIGEQYTYPWRDSY